jgi:hypothetical protein
MDKTLEELDTLLSEKSNELSILKKEISDLEEMVLIKTIQRSNEMYCYIGDIMEIDGFENFIFEGYFRALAPIDGDGDIVGKVQLDPDDGYSDFDTESDISSDLKQKIIDELNETDMLDYEFEMHYEPKYIKIDYSNCYIDGDHHHLDKIFNAKITVKVSVPKSLIKVSV